MQKLVTILLAALVCALCWLPLTHAQAPVVPGSTSVGGSGASQAFVPYSASNPLNVVDQPYPSGATAITGNAQGTTGAVVGTLAAAAGKTTYICGLHIDATGSGSIGPVTVAGVVGSSFVFQGSAAAANNGVPVVNFTPCIPASAPNTAITTTTTADGTATAVDVNTWGYQK